MKPSNKRITGARFFLDNCCDLELFAFLYKAREFKRPVFTPLSKLTLR